MVVMTAWLGLLLAAAATTPAEMEKARDRQDRPALEAIAAESMRTAEKETNDAGAQYRAALAQSYVAEVAIEVRDRNAAKNAAEAGIRAAQRAVALKPDSAEYHRVLGTLCGQVIPANAVLGGMKYGKCAKEAVNKATELDPKSPVAWIAHGVGNYYLPAALGGGVELAIQDFEKAIKLDGKSADAHLWLGIALRQTGRNADARKALQKALELNPNRIWAKQQLDKTPAQ